MAEPKCVRINKAYFDQETSQITMNPTLSYLKAAPLGLAELSEAEALDLAQSLILAVQRKRLVEVAPCQSVPTPISLPLSVRVGRIRLSR